MPMTVTTPRPMTTAPPATTVTGGANLQLIFCNDPDTVCVFNPDENATGPLPIDPRVGTTPGPSAAFRSDIDSQVPSYDTAVRFPRQRRDVQLISIKDFLNELSKTDDKHIISKRQSCRCVPSGTCINNGNNSPAGMIDVRIVTPGGTQCPSGQEYCCGNTTAPIVDTTQIACGTVQTVPTTAVVPTTGQANFGEFPWQALILTKQNDYIAGGVLIDSLNVVTVTHRLASYVVSGTAPNIKVRLGEWDAAGTYEPIPYQEYTVQKVFTHPSYNVNTLQFDITVLRLTAAVPFTPSAGAAKTINRACLPSAANASYTGQRCFVSGWGKDMFGISGQYQQILKKVEVPIVAPDVCQNQLRSARLGPTYVLDTTSFVCAGGEANKDSCTGDGGSGLVCQKNGQWVAVGLVAWGLGCASANVSGVYVNIAGLLPWIQAQVATT
ncbi:hypothetical protein O3G_MSEX001273 [Manduca sexta]|uniref:Peptidase S1 domain-containing protein n=1 Tax=Manduca sexta TaxID=7130 RepID=A0A922C980_MANSE|nr:hypothetical protein O3G_MSEX001273 [Manduca sexta]